MGCFDTVVLNCPSCRAPHYAQSKMGDCMLKTYHLHRAPMAVLAGLDDVFCCEKCDTTFNLDIHVMAQTVIHHETDEDYNDDL